MTQNETWSTEGGKTACWRSSPEKGDDEQRLKQWNPQTDIHRGALQHSHRATEENPTHLWMEIFPVWPQTYSPWRCCTWCPRPWFTAFPGERPEKHSALFQAFWPAKGATVFYARLKTVFIFFASGNVFLFASWPQPFCILLVPLCTPEFLMRSCMQVLE